MLTSTFAPLVLSVSAIVATSVAGEPLGDLALTASRPLVRPRSLVIAAMTSYAAATALIVGLLSPWPSGKLVFDAIIFLAVSITSGALAGCLATWALPLVLVVLQVAPLGLPAVVAAWAYDGLSTRQSGAVAIGVMALAVVLDAVASRRGRPVLLRVNALRQLQDASEAI